MNEYPAQEDVNMGALRRMYAAGLGLVIAVSAMGSEALAQEGLAAFQGAWLAGSDCTQVYSSAAKGTTFKRPVDMFAPAFIVSGSRLRTPQASCRIKSIQPSGDRRLLLLDCANAVAGNEVRVLMALQSDGTLKRYFDAGDTIGTSYRRCSP
jgi:hypothetical protein